MSLGLIVFDFPCQVSKGRLVDMAGGVTAVS